MDNGSKHGLLPAYLIVGKDGHKRDAAIRRLEGHLNGEFADFNLERLEARGGLSGPELVSSLQSIPFADDLRIVEVRGAGELSKDVSEAIIGYLDDPNPSSVLCLVADSLAKTTRLHKAVSKIGGSAVISCEPPTREGDLISFIQGIARLMGRRLGYEAARELCSRAGTSTAHLERQLRSLVDVLDGKGEIEVEDVALYVERVADVMWWDVVDAVACRNRSKALTLYGKMADPPYVLLQIKLAERYRELIHTRSLVAGGRCSQKEIASALKCPSWKVDKVYIPEARLYADGECERALCSLVDFEQAIKGSADEDVAFVRFVDGVCRKG